MWWEKLPEHTILTPHPGEMARLCDVDTAEVQQNRWQLAQEKSKQWQVILVLKGAHTVIATPQGEVTILPFKTSALATAGTGDVLAGVITACIGQGMAPSQAAVAGSYIHGSAGLIAAETIGNTYSVTARDVLHAVPQAISLLLSN